MRRSGAAKLMRCEITASSCYALSTAPSARLGPRQGEGALQRRLIRSHEPNIGAASLAPSAGHRAKDIGLRLDQHGLLFRGQYQRAPFLVRIAERCKDALAGAKIGVPLVRALDHPRQTQGNTAKAVRRHGFKAYATWIAAQEA